MAALLVAGIVHLLIAPVHMDHSPAHGIFFGFAGLMQLGWAVEFRASPTRRMLQVGIALSAGMVALWALTLVLGAPFAPAPEPIDWSVYASKIAEGIGAGALAVMGWRGEFAEGADGATARRTVTEGFGMALAVCIGSYGGAWLVEPFLPGLAEGPGHTHTSTAAPLNAVFSNGMLITGAWVRPPQSPGGNAALFFSITNLSGRDDTLVSVETTSASRAQIAQSIPLAGDLAQTALVASLPVGQSGPLIFGPGGDSVLLVGLNGTLRPGQIVAVRLTFQRAGPVEVKAEVVAAPVTTQ